MATRFISFEKFKNYSFIFENISKNDVLKKELAEYGYGEKEIAQGKVLYDTAAQIYETNKRETSEEALAYNEFSKKLEAFKNVYATETAKRLKSFTKRSLKSLLPFISREWHLCVPISSLKTSRRSTKSSKLNPICSLRSTNLKSLLSISKPSSPSSPM